MGIQVLLTDVVIDYPSLFTAREFKGKRKFQGTFVFDKGGESDKKIQAAIAEAKATRPGTKLKEVYYDGDKEYPGNVHYAGKMFIRVSRNEGQGAPPVFNMDNTQMSVMDAAKIYRGAKVNAYVDAYVPKSPNDDKVCWGLTGVQLSGDGERITGENDVDPSTLFQPLDAGQEKPSFLT